MKKIYYEDAIRIIKIFGENVQKIRQSKNISIKKMSEKTGIRENYLKKIEKRRSHRYNNIKNICYC